MSEPKLTAPEIIDQMVDEPTLDHFYRIDPKAGTPEERAERLDRLIELQRRDRAVFIKTAADRKNKRDGHVPAEETEDE